MAKELPYFKFEPAEYLTKDISFCTLEAQGLFINICSYYWQRGCELTKKQLLKRLNHEPQLNELISEGIIDLEGDNIYIKFLDRQLVEVLEKSKINTLNGSKGGRPKKAKENPKKTETKPNGFKKETETKGIREDKIRLENNNTSTKVDLSFDFDAYIKAINETFGKNHRVVTPKLRRQITALLKTGLTKEDIMTAIENCKNSEFHKKENYRHCTPEFFSRIDKVDYWSDVTETKKQKIQL